MVRDDLVLAREEGVVQTHFLVVLLLVAHVLIVELLQHTDRLLLQLEHPPVVLGNAL